MEPTGTISEIGDFEKEVKKSINKSFEKVPEGSPVTNL